MAKTQHILAIDQGTTSTRAMVYDLEGRCSGVAQEELAQIFPRDGWVEHDPEELWRATLNTAQGAIASAGLRPGAIAAVGLTNQRETTVLWDRKTGAPVHNAIVWQDRRTAKTCRDLVAGGYLKAIRERTGLVVDPYFSATKLGWLLNNVDGARTAAEAGKLAFGTIDSFLLWRLTGGKVHATDATNAARTMLFDIYRQDWDEHLLTLFNIPRAILPEVRDNTGELGTLPRRHLGAALPITGMAGDQQAALVGQACFESGMVKATYGTGAFVLMNTGSEPVQSRHRLLTTIAYRRDGATVYALEGSIFIAGAVVQWLRDALKLMRKADSVERLAKGAKAEAAVYFVPAFTGLGAPYWDADARGAILGLTRDSGPNEIARAALEAVAFQTRDLMNAFAADGIAATDLRVDGGMVVNDWLMQRVADFTGIPVRRPEVAETTALGAAFLAGLGAGLFDDLDAVARAWRQERRFEPAIDDDERSQRYAGWQDAVRRVLTSPAG